MKVFAVLMVLGFAHPMFWVLALVSLVFVNPK